MIKKIEQRKVTKIATEMLECISDPKQSRPTVVIYWGPEPNQSGRIPLLFRKQSDADKLCEALQKGVGKEYNVFVKSTFLQRKCKEFAPLAAGYSKLKTN